MNSKEKLAQALEHYKYSHTYLIDDLIPKQISGIDQLIINARNGDYSDYDSTKHELPQIEFVNQWNALGLPTKTTDSIAYRMTQGEFDATKEEADAWFEREGRDIVQSEIPPSMWEMFGMTKEEKEAKEGIKGFDI